MPLPHPERLAQHRDRPGHTHPPDEGHPPRGQRLPPRRHHETRGQLPQPQASAALRGGLFPEPRMGMLRVDRLLQPRQFPPQVARPVSRRSEQPRLEPAVEVLYVAVELRLPCRDEDRPDAEALHHRSRVFSS